MESYKAVKVTYTTSAASSSNNQYATSGSPLSFPTFPPVATETSRATMNEFKTVQLNDDQVNMIPLALEDSRLHNQHVVNSFPVYVETKSNAVPHYDTNGLFFSSHEPINWSNIDTYLHIFLTVFFGHFASMLFFDGILRNIANLFIYSHPAIYIIHILFSIAYLSFTIWFLTICWRWWRNKSLLPFNQEFDNQKYFTSKQQRQIAQNYTFIAAVMLIIGFFIFIILGVIDLSIKTRYAYAVFYGDLMVFIFRLLLWLLAIGAILCLNREYIGRYFVPRQSQPVKAQIISNGV